MLNSEEKSNIIGKFKIHDKDTGSDEIQAGLLTIEIQKLLAHLKKHPKDAHSKRGLLKMVSKRRKVLKYLKKKDEKKYSEVLKEIGLKK